MAAEVTMAVLATLSSESSFAGAPTDASSNVASFSSTPPTTVSPDSMSPASDPEMPKPDATAAAITPLFVEAAIIPLLGDKSEEPESGRQTPIRQDAIVVADEEPPFTEPPSTGRTRRARASLPVYNLSRLSGTHIHGKRRANGDEVGVTVTGKRRRTVSGDSTLVNDSEDGRGESTDALAAGPSTPQGARIAKKPLSKAAAAKASAEITRRATRLSGAPAENLASKLLSLGKRGKKSFQKSVASIPRELRRLQDTNEFAHIDTRPVRYTVWANGKYVDPNSVEEEKGDDKSEDDKANTGASPLRKKAKVDDSAAAASPRKKENAEPAKSEADEPAPKTRRVKKWLEKGLYAGQEAPIDISKGLTTQEKKKLATIPELVPSGRANRTLPLPMFNGLRLLIIGRDFKLPYDVCNPLPPGQPKPAAYRTMTKNRFVGDAAAYWKKTPHFGDFASKCVCKPEDGCAEDCQNRIMLYECDETNCNVGKAHCQNRAFQMLQERTKKGGRYRVGVEVYKTPDRGYGVRSNRCFEANQIIMEYTGEIITEEECERRMNEVYKDNECYYLMSFDQNMIIDATTGSIARFVNHSCSPNCRMIKWIVSGQPRMALFAGDRPIMTGDELTYDYNFDPFSAKNVQKCLCGSPNCRGVLGPKPKEVKPPKPSKEEMKSSKKKSTVKGTVKAGKRKLKELLSGDGDEQADAKTAKKRKIKTATGVAKGKAVKGKPSLKTGKAAAKIKLTGKVTAKGKATALKAATKGAAKGATSTIKRGASSVSVKARSALFKKTTATGYVSARGAAEKTKPTKTAATSRLVQTKISFAKGTALKKGLPRKSSSAVAAAPKPKPQKSSASFDRSSPNTIVAEPSYPRSTPKSKTATPTSSSRKRTLSRKALESNTGSPAGGDTPSGKGWKSKNGLAKVQLPEDSVYDFPN